MRNQVLVGWPRVAVAINGNSISLRLAERHIAEDARRVHGINKAHFPKISLPFAVLAFCQVTTSLLPTQNLSGSGDFESFGDGFPCFASSYGFSHRGAEPSELCPARNSEF